jgi:hypothetical protein
VDGWRSGKTYRSAVSRWPLRRAAGTCSLPRRELEPFPDCQIPPLLWLEGAVGPFTQRDPAERGTEWQLIVASSMRTGKVDGSN